MKFVSGGYSGLHVKRQDAKMRESQEEWRFRGGCTIQMGTNWTMGSLVFSFF